MSQNIALISWDSVRADHMPFHGYKRNTTPFLNKLAGDSLVFEDTYVSGVGTPTSFTGVFTGQHAHGAQTNVEPENWTESNAGKPMLAEKLQDAGYTTGAIHGNALMSKYYGWDRGWDVFDDRLWTAGGEARKTKVLPMLRKLGVAGEAIHAKNLVLGASAYEPWENLWEHIEHFVETAPEPWFLWVLLVDTHHPWCAPTIDREWKQPGQRGIHILNYTMRRRPSWVSRWRQQIINSYDNELRHADRFLEQFHSLLGNDDALIMHSDHGDELGEHNDYGHAPAMWDTVTRVPLVMHNVKGSGRVEGPHSLLNLGSTILDIAGSGDRLQNRDSLFDLEYSPGPVHIENRTEDGRAMRATVFDDVKVVESEDGKVVVYPRVDNYEVEGIETVSGCDYELRVHEQKSRPDPGDMEASGVPQTKEQVMERLEELGYL